jgi:hypothetical protein
VARSFVVHYVYILKGCKCAFFRCDEYHTCRSDYVSYVICIHLTSHALWCVLSYRPLPKHQSSFSSRVPMTNSSYDLTDGFFSALAIVRLPSDGSIVKQRINRRKSPPLCAAPLPVCSIVLMRQEIYTLCIQESVAPHPW